MITVPNQLLDTEVVHERRETQDDGMGGQISEFNVIGFKFVRISQPLDEEVRVALQEEKRFTHRVYCNPDEDVDRGDRFTTHDGLTMTVEAVIVPSYPAYKRAQCQATQEGW